MSYTKSFANTESSPAVGSESSMENLLSESPKPTIRAPSLDSVRRFRRPRYQQIEESPAIDYHHVSIITHTLILGAAQEIDDEL